MSFDRIDAFCRNNKQTLLFGHSDNKIYHEMIADYVDTFGSTHHDVNKVNIGPYKGSVVYIHYILNPELEEMLEL